jgi:hypothetical protein
VRGAAGCRASYTTAGGGSDATTSSWSSESIRSSGGPRQSAARVQTGPTTGTPAPLRQRQSSRTRHAPPMPPSRGGQSAATPAAHPEPAVTICPSCPPIRATGVRGPLPGSLCHARVMSDELPAWDALYREIGRVAQAHVQLDMSVRNVFVKLAMPSLAVYLVNDSASTAAVVDSCRTMLRRVEGTEQLLSAGLLALESAKQAGEERNRVVHDMWLPDFDGDVAQPERWSVQRSAKGAFGMRHAGMRDLESVKRARSKIDRANTRVTALLWALDGVLPFFLGSGIEGPMPLEDWIAVMEDRFDALENGGFRPHTHNWPQGSPG